MLTNKDCGKVSEQFLNVSFEKEEEIFRELEHVTQHTIKTLLEQHVCI